MAGILCTDYGNPSSLHHKGVQAEEYVRHAREVIAHMVVLLNLFGKFNRAVTV